MSVNPATRDTFEKTVAENDIVLIDFWAEWCGPCRMFGPVFEKVADKNPDIAFVKCNTEEQPELAAQFGIRSIPTLGIFRDGVLLYLQPGSLPETALEDVVAKVRELDMDKVREDMDAHAKKEQAKRA